MQVRRLDDGHHQDRYHYLPMKFAVVLVVRAIDGFEHLSSAGRGDPAFVSEEPRPLLQDTIKDTLPPGPLQD